MGIKKKLLKMCLIATVSMQCLTVYGEIFVDNVSYVCQMPELPTGCEITALEILMRQSGFNVTKDELAKKVKKASNPVWKNGVYYAENPNNYFVGDPFEEKSYGVYVGGIIDLMSEYMPRQQIQNLTGSNFSELEKVVKTGRPVMIWSTLNQVEPVYTVTWVTPEGGKFTWKKGEHALVVIGFNDNYVWTSDPAKGVLRKYPKERFIDVYNKMGKQAVAIYSKQEAVTKYSELSLKINGESLGYTGLQDSKGNTWIPLKCVTKLSNNAYLEYATVTKEVVLTTSLYGLPVTITHKDGKTYKNGQLYDISFLKYNNVNYVKPHWIKSFYNIDSVIDSKSVNFIVNK